MEAIDCAGAVQVITGNDSVVSSQCVGGEERYKHIGLSSAGIIAVITDETETSITFDN